MCSVYLLSVFFFNDPATTEIYTLSLHDALPISPQPLDRGVEGAPANSDGGLHPGSTGLLRRRLDGDTTPRASGVLHGTAAFRRDDPPGVAPVGIRLEAAPLCPGPRSRV